MLVISLASGCLLTYLRYSNQNLLLSGFSIMKTGNLLTLVSLLIYIGFIVYNIFSKSKYHILSLVILICISSTGLLFIGVSALYSDKDYKVAFSLTFLVCYVYTLVSLITITFTRSKMLHIFNNIGIMLIVALTGFIFNIYQIYNFKDDSESYMQAAGSKKADAGVILGAAVWGGNRPSPVLRERINKGFELYQKKIIQKFILTGGGSPNELTEAEVEKNELKKFGVDEKNLIVEVKSNSTIEQIHFVRDKHYKKNNWSRIILISDNFHLFRTSEICRFNNMNVDCIASDTPLSAESRINFSIKESIAVLFFWIFGIG
ncbi:MAG: YdcF family protein [Ignavibacteriae bacterium]|nr:YdcF family protein [Ignavibacteriota bacterium]